MRNLASVEKSTAREGEWPATVTTTEVAGRFELSCTPDGAVDDRLHALRPGLALASWYWGALEAGDSNGASVCEVGPPTGWTQRADW